MLELPALGTTWTVLLILAVAGVISWGITQIVKSAILWHQKAHHDRWWFNPAVRLVALVTGGAVGYLLLPGVVGAGMGGAAGVLNSTIIMIVRSRLKGVTSGVDDGGDDRTDPPTGA